MKMKSGHKFNISNEGTTAHSASRRFVIRLLLCYVTVYCVNLFGDVISFCLHLFSAPLKYQVPFPALFWGPVVPWVSMHVLHLGTVKRSIWGSGDTLYDWVQMLCEAILALLLALVWTLVDRDQRRCSRFHLWLRVAVRALLAAQMFSYGLDKVFPMQFHEMTIARMMLPMASKTPMDVLWDFMAASTGYTIFTGLVEVLAGILLLVPAWTTLGALITMIAMTNIVALNFFYDIPVKRGSSHLLLVSLFLLAPAFSRLVRFFLLNRDVPAEPPVVLSGRKHMRQAALWLPVALCGIVVIAGCFSGFSYFAKHRQAHLLQSRLYGAWDVDRFTTADASKPIFTDTLMKDMDIPHGGTNWRRLMFEGRDSAIIEVGDGRLDWVNVKDEGGTLTITDPGDPVWQCVLNASQVSPDRLTLVGTINGNAVKATLRRVDESRLVLTKRRFHWINEW